tara:strand:+ start:1218 stop:1484 length:267 start_codon:yes stop_codon:yes gene_type:complete
MEIVLTNLNGVNIVEPGEGGGPVGKHCFVENAKCWCGENLMVAPPIFQPQHKKGDPELRCADHGIHAYMFHELEKGQQEKPSQYQMEY